MWLLVPRGGRGRGLRGLTPPDGGPNPSRRRALLLGALGLAAIVIAVVLGLRGGDPPEPERPPTVLPGPTSRPSRPAPAQPRPQESSGSLEIGITEPNPAFVSTSGTHEPFERWRGELAKLEPSFYRLVVDWPVLQPQRRVAPRTDVAIGGCLRDVPPCAAWNGLRDQLRALASRQRDGPGEWEALVVITGTPDWAAEPASGCESAGTAPRSRPPRPAAIPAYRALIRAVDAEADAQGARLRYWSPWNEPNHPYFLSPQRDACEGPSVAAAPYVRMAEAMRITVAQRQEIVLGELAGLYRPSPRATTVREFIADLPRGLVCSTLIWGQHAYVGGRDPVQDAAEALRAKRCANTHEIWITETGAGRASAGEEGVQRSAAARLRDCRDMNARLRRWYRDPRVTAAFQYTLREDDRFPTGLVSTALDEAFPALAMWQAWGSRPRPTARPPRSPCAAR